uniref:Uncharacterized protein n=1 Tax=Romanomermis culicivorax TaxID=13658 RepID=A0A915L905_ROMCU
MADATITKQINNVHDVGPNCSGDERIHYLLLFIQSPTLFTLRQKHIENGNVIAIKIHDKMVKIHPQTPTSSSMTAENFGKVKIFWIFEIKRQIMMQVLYRREAGKIDSVV